MRDFKAELKASISKINAGLNATEKVEAPKVVRQVPSNSLYTIYKIVPNVSKVPVAFNLPRKDAEQMLRSALKPQLVKIADAELTLNGMDSEFTTFEAVSNTDCTDVFTLEYRGNLKSNSDDTRWVD